MIMRNDTEYVDTGIDGVDTEAEDTRIIAWMHKNQAMQKKYGEALKAMIHDWDYDRTEVLSFVAIFFDENPRD
jgi:hypothetical protein